MQEEVNTCIFNLLNFVNSISFEQAHLVMISVIQSINELISEEAVINLITYCSGQCEKEMIYDYMIILYFL